MNHTSPRLRMTGKFLALSLLLTSASVMAMDSGCPPDISQLDERDQRDQVHPFLQAFDQKIRANVGAKPKPVTELLSGEKSEEKLSNKEEKPKYESIPFKLWQFAKEKGMIDKVQKIYELSRSRMQAVTQSKGGKATIEKTKKLVVFLKQYGLYDKVIPGIAGSLGYLLGEYLLPINCVDLPGIRPSCVMSTTPIGGGVCFPFATLVCSNLKYLSALGITSLTYLLTKQDQKQKSE